ncbi:MAG: prepilin-type N-terminal cleavage/methylation domain-containing protein [Candidatus Dactylopiibacterium sp.]|nr:prepilin-type N-terminal cleavage/methylation domain-containing protein [Candidatus Dactylopiibacterium sp.]
MKKITGFTLAELVVTLSVIGILAAFAMPRFMTRGDFDVFGYSESLRQSLRFAQKSAVAKRRLVCVTLAAGRLGLSTASTFGSTSCDRPLKDPASGNDFDFVAPTGVNVPDTSFTFDPAGRASTAQSLVISYRELSQTVRVEAETGYVR